VLYYVDKMSDTSVLLELKGVSKSYAAAGGGPSVTVLREISLQLGRGESMAVVGPSGAGKSTLLNIIGTLDTADRGEVLLAGQSLRGLGEVEVARVRNTQFGFVFQGHHLLPQCTVLENVLLPTLAVSSADRHAAAGERAKQLLKRVGLEHRLEHRPGQLSGGEKQRVAVVRALINSPKLLLADEPTGALDATSASNLGDLLAALNREDGLTLMVVTHAASLAGRMGRVFELREGALNPVAPK